MEPGRFLVGPAGVLAYDRDVSEGGGRRAHAGGGGRRDDDLIRPALYGAWHPVWPVEEGQADQGDVVDVVGPVCESADVLARGRRLGTVRSGDVLTIGQAGAYGFSMASQYNGRPRPAEVLVDGTNATLVRRREAYEDLWGQ